MGWWGCGPMEGDAPMDARAAIEDKLIGHAVGDVDFVGDDYDAQCEADTDTVLQQLTNPKIVKDLAKNIPTEGVIFEPNEYLHALGVMVMEAGGPLSIFKKKLLTAIKQDEWSAEDEERAQEMDRFRREVEAYVDGTKYHHRTMGLMEAIGKHISKGNGGLVNK